MDLRSILLLLSALALAATGFFYGYKFIKRDNYLIGVEWMLLGLSSSNAFIFFLTNSSTSFAIAHFFDAFSRAFGVPVVVPIGMMALTHKLKPSIAGDVGIFLASFAATAVMLEIKSFEPVLPYFLLFMSCLYAAYLVYFARKLLAVGETTRAIGVMIVTASCFVIACIDDFYKIPGEDTNVVFNFYTLALFTWSFMTVQLYYAYCALERAVGEGRGQIFARRVQ